MSCIFALYWHSNFANICSYGNVIYFSQLLCELQFDENIKFKAVINADNPEDQRLKPVGRNDDGCLYWHQQVNWYSYDYLKSTRRIEASFYFFTIYRFRMKISTLEYILKIRMMTMNQGGRLHAGSIACFIDICQIMGRCQTTCKSGYK